MKIIDLNQIQETPVSHNPAIKKKVLLANDVIPGLTQYAQSTFPPGEIASAHAHIDMYEVFLVIKGSGTITIDDTEVKLSAGVCIVVEPTEQHEIKAGQDGLTLNYFGTTDRSE